MFACSVMYRSLLILYYIFILLLLLPTWRIKPGPQVLLRCTLDRTLLCHPSSSSNGIVMFNVPLENCLPADDLTGARNCSS